MSWPRCDGSELPGAEPGPDRQLLSETKRRRHPTRGRRGSVESPVQPDALEFEPPGVESFDLPPLYEGAPAWLDKYSFMAAVSVIVILAFWLIMARKNALVPSKGQFIGETAYFFVRNSIARDMIGHDFRRYLPFLIAIFSFVLLNNLWGIFPFLLLPTPSHVGWSPTVWPSWFGCSTTG